MIQTVRTVSTKMFHPSVSSYFSNRLTTHSLRLFYRSTFERVTNGFCFRFLVRLRTFSYRQGRQGMSDGSLVSRLFFQPPFEHTLKPPPHISFCPSPILILFIRRFSLLFLIRRYLGNVWRLNSLPH